jgi:haloacetate dehalogenase
MANALIEVMQSLGHLQFGVIGHDRGGRVGYRMALDHPGRVTKLSVLDIIPTLDMWKGMDAKRAMVVYHWPFLAQRAPLPEMLISKAPLEYIDWTLGSWAPDGLKKFDPRALAHYRAFFQDPARIHACCEDYRAGQSTDVKFDEEDFNAGKKITCPTLALWGSRGIPNSGGDPLGSGSNGPRSSKAAPSTAGIFCLRKSRKKRRPRSWSFSGGLDEAARCVPPCELPGAGVIGPVHPL